MAMTDRRTAAASDADSLEWRTDFIQTFLERDLPQLGVSIPHADVRTTMIYLHVMNRGALGVRSPFDRL